MASFDHYALGGGRRLAAPHARAPGRHGAQLAPTADRARPRRWPHLREGARETPYGRAEAGDASRATPSRVDVRVPPKATAEVQLPIHSEPFGSDAGTHTFHRPHSTPPSPPTEIRHPSVLKGAEVPSRFGTCRQASADGPCQGRPIYEGGALARHLDDRAPAISG